MSTLLARYLDPDVLNRVADRPISPRELVVGTLAGAHKSPLSGFAVEFAGHREYVPGDDPRHIDWKVFYKRDRYVIKQYEMETNFVCHLGIDVSASMLYGDGPARKLDYAAKLASTLAYCILRQNDRVSLTLFDDQIRGHVPPANSMAQFQRITDQLDKISAVAPTRLADCLMEWNGRTGRREILLIVSDFLVPLDGLEAALQRMRYNRHEVVLFQVLHRHEREFNLDGLIKFRGLETPDELMSQTDDIRRSYLKALAKHDAGLLEICRRNRIERVALDSTASLADSLVDYLNERLRVRLAR